jgi:hypothetical protein
VPRPPSIQWYYKQYLGDNKVLAMDWDARGMHVHLLMLSIQEEPPGTIPADDAAIRRWLSLPSSASLCSQHSSERGSASKAGYDSGYDCRCNDCVWRRVKSQLLAAWQPNGDRLGNSGMMKACERRDHYLDRYENGTKKARDSINTEDKEVISTLKNKDTKLFHEELSPDLPISALAVGFLGKIGIPGTVSLIQLAASSIEIVMAEEHLAPPRACDWLISAAKGAQGRREKVDRFWLEGGIQRWRGQANEREPSKTKQRIIDNRRNILAGLGIGQDAGPVGSSDAAGADAGRDPPVVRDVQRDSAGDSGSGIPRSLKDGKILPKAR